MYAYLNYMIIGWLGQQMQHFDIMLTFTKIDWL